MEPETATVAQFNFFNQERYTLTPVSWSRLPLLPRCNWSNNFSFVEHGSILPQALAHALNPIHFFEYIKTPIHLFDIFTSLYSTPPEFCSPGTTPTRLIHGATLRMAHPPTHDYFGEKSFWIAFATLQFSNGEHEYTFTMGEVDGDFNYHPDHGAIPNILIGWGQPVISSGGEL